MLASLPRRSFIVASFCGLSASAAMAQQQPDGINYLPGSGSDNALFLAQELTTARGDANTTSVYQIGTLNEVGETNALAMFATGFSGSTPDGQAALQYGINNAVNANQTGEGNILSFLQGVSAAEAVNFQTTMNEIGAYGITASNAYGTDIDHSALAAADALATNLNSWVAAGITSDSSSADLNQTGDDNTIMLYQLGDNLIANITQTGNTNEAWTTTATHDSTVTIDQINGDDNTAVVTQYGDSRGGLAADATITQDGSDNTTNITQVGLHGAASLTASIEQTGDFNTASIYQAGQSGSGDTISIKQTGNSNTAMMSIFGQGNSGTIVQTTNGAFANLQFTGDNNTASITQQQSNAYASLELSGDNNSITIQQLANSSPIVLDISGSSNRMRITQR